MNSLCIIANMFSTSPSKSAFKPGKHLLIKIDGAIEVKSTLGVGSKFIIKIKGQ